MTQLEFTVDSEFAGQRIDLFLSNQSEDLTRSFIKKQILNGHVTHNGDVVKPNFKVEVGACVILTVPEPTEIDAQPEDIAINIVYEDEDIVVVNKHKGMVVHPAPGNYTGTLVNALLYHCTSLSGINGEVRPGIVHRIDKNTSGLLVVAKNDQAHKHLAKQIEEKSAKRIYWALAHGNVKDDEGTVNQPIGRDPKDRKKMNVARSGGGKSAVTHFKVVERYGQYTLLELSLETGRTHQIRVHLKYLGHPIVGDPEYGIKKERFKTEGQLLHAKKLILVHPRSLELMTFVCELSEDFTNVLNKIEDLKH